MSAWLDDWCKTRRLSQNELARRWANRNEPATVVAAVVPEVSAPAQPLPFAHTKFILNHGTRAYRQWVADGCPADTVAETEGR